MDAAAVTPRVVSGMRPTGKLHLGHLVGALQNWTALQAKYDCFYFVADWHALTSEYASTGPITGYALDNAADWIAAGVDPENRLLWRANRRRLSAEEIRDGILALGDRVDTAMGGTLLANKNHTYVTSTASVNDVKYDNARRSVYLPVVRSAVYEVLGAFDFADPSTSLGKRPATTVAPQALFMMNSPLVERQTRAMAERLLAQEVGDPQRVVQAYQGAYCREATPDEVQRALAFVSEYRSRLAGQNLDERESRLRAWQGLCRVILSSNEFVYLE